MNDKLDNNDTGDESEPSDKDTFLSSALESLDAMANSPADNSTSNHPVPSDEQIPRLDDMIIDDELGDITPPDYASPSPSTSPSTGVDLHDMKAQFATELMADLDGLAAQITHDAVAETVEKVMLDTKLRLEENLLAEIKAALQQLVEGLQDKDSNNE